MSPAANSAGHGTPTAANKELVLRFFDALGRGDREELLAVLAEDLVWVVPSGAAMLAGRHHGASNVIDRMFGAMGDTFVPGSAQTKIQQLIAEGDVVMAETNLTAERPDGARYDNHYVFVFEIGDGRIRELREHVDTAYAADFFGA